jgi:hypothetical protein
MDAASVRWPRAIGAAAALQVSNGVFSLFYSLMITGFDGVRSLVVRHEMVGAGVRSLTSHIKQCLLDLLRMFY